MGSCSLGQAGCLQFLPSWVLSASLNTQSCGQVSLKATDYCFLKFICIRKSFKKHFPHLSLGAPAHQTKPPVWFSAAVNFTGLVSTRLQGGKQQLHSVRFSILCLAASCQDLAWFAQPPPSELLGCFFLSGTSNAFRGSRGWEPGLSDREVRGGLPMLSLRGELSSPESEIMNGMRRRRPR